MGRSAKVAGVALTCATAVGATIGWLIGQLAHHLQHEGLSDHARHHEMIVGPNDWLTEDQ